MTANNYYEINVMPIRQIQTGTVLMGKLQFKQLLTIHRLTERKESLIDPFEEKKVNVEFEEEEFQRQLSPNKLNKIGNFLREQFELYKEKKSIGIFPTAIIVALDHDVDYDSDKLDEKLLEEQYFEKLSSCFIKRDSVLYIPKNKRVALIVDGQHRFYGVKKFYESIQNEEDKKFIEDFEFPTTFLIGFDIYQLGEVFATVNFNQKPVNRSLYYDIFGSVPETEKNDIKLAHDLALHLNNNEESPIKDMIKMLGKGYGLFSQSFFVEKMLIHFKSGGVWEKIYSDYMTNGKQYKKLPIFMKIYLTCVEETFISAWPTRIEKNGKLVYSPYNYEFILCKTTGMGAIFRLIKDIYPLVENLSEKEMHDKIIDILDRVRKDSKEIFSKNGAFGMTGGEGLQVKLYRFLKLKLKLI